MPKQDQVKPKQDHPNADILSALAELNRGKFILTAGQKLGELIAAIRDVNAKGKMTITLEISPSGMKDDGTVDQCEVKPTVTISKPEHPQRKSIFFVTDTCGLTRDDPNQMDMQFEETPETVRDEK